MKKMFVLAVIVSGIFLFSAFINKWGEDEPVFVPPSKQRSNGDAQKGYQYLITGDYVKGGLPYKIFIERFGKNKYNNQLNRDGLNKDLPYDFTAITAYNGEILAVPNCLQCHAHVFDDKLYVGLGNSAMDFSVDSKENIKMLNKAVFFLKTFQPKQYNAAKDFFEISKIIGPHLQTEVRGVNSADRLAAVLAAHRDPVTFKWSENVALQIPGEMIPSDTPPWWLLKKKNAMFYNGFGRGDFGKFLMASHLLTVRDTAESQEVDRHMPDLLAYIFSIEAPAYPKNIDQELAARGKILFENNCSACHGTYDNKESYPNLLIPASVIQTDSFLYKSNYSNPQFVNWFNRSWFTQGSYPAKLEPFNGYIAPPLDGIWITAPYLHNGSVPTLEEVLNSNARPRYWSRNFDAAKYDYEKVGWIYTVHSSATKKIYNTDLPGYGNYGHYFGDKLTAAERKAVIEYLKTL